MTLKSGMNFFMVKEKKLSFLLKKRKQSNIFWIEGSIRDLKAKLEPNKDSVEFKSQAEKMSKNMIQKDNENKQRKIGKFLRDCNDYKMKKVFKWQQQTTLSPPSSTSLQNELLTLK